MVEIVIVVAIIGLLSSIVMVSFPDTQYRARDADRLQRISQIVDALRIYHSNTGTFPDPVNDTCCDGWDQGPCDGDDTFIEGLLTSKTISMVPVGITTQTGNGCYGFAYYLYDAGSRDCDIDRGKFFVVGVRDLESVDTVHPESPGWSCGAKDWQEDFEWVAGGFEN